MTRRLARLLLAGEIGREFGELLVAGLPQSAQLEEDERTEAGGGVREQVAERIELLLDAQRRALLLLQSIAQDMKLVLEIGVCLFRPARFWNSCMRRSSSALTPPLSDPPLRKLSLSIKCPASSRWISRGTPGGIYPLEVMASLGAVFQPFI